jgi:hypothetical protein
MVTALFPYCKAEGFLLRVCRGMGCILASCAMETLNNNLVPCLIVDVNVV